MTTQYTLPPDELDLVMWGLAALQNQVAKKSKKASDESREHDQSIAQQ
jgi:hypothetical protein